MLLDDITISTSDILEDDIFHISPRLLNELLKDHSATRALCTPEQVARGQQVNIFWATDIYSKRYGEGCGYDYRDPITIEKITGENGAVVQPRVNKSREEQLQRLRDKAEVFTPSWICNKQNNLVDNAWFGRPNVFNTEVDSPDGTHTWRPTEGKIVFPQKHSKRWQAYVLELRMEITCGEAPYLVSRYDTITGEYIPLPQRIGLLDRKLRVIGENVDDEKRWWHYAKQAFQSTYGYDWQGDNVLLAREALLLSFIEYYSAKFGHGPSRDQLQRIAYVISWNIWQMDGLKCVVPDSCHAQKTKRPTLFANDTPARTIMCPGCSSGDPARHNGIQCLVRDWRRRDPQRHHSYTDIPFYSLFSNNMI